MSKKERNQISFTPRYSIFTKNQKTLKFDMLSNFDFSSIKNLISIKIITPAVGVFVNFFAGFKNNKVAIKATLLLSKLNIFGKFKSNIKLNTTVSASLKIISIPIPQKINIRSDINPRMKLFLQSHNTINLINTVNTHIVLYANSKIGLKVKTGANLSITFKALTDKNNIRLVNNNPDLTFQMFAKIIDNNVSLQSDINLSIKFMCSSYLNKIKINSYANAIVYKPICLGDLYNQRIGDWYDKTIEEIFYGHQIE